MAEKKKYTASQKVLDAEAAVQAHQKTKPGAFSSAYEEELKQVMERILGREDFRYSLDGDALYQQYRNAAVQNGRLAMADTMGQAAALTGGYGSSYAQSVGQQAYNRQLDALADRIPELYSLAMNQYKLQTQGLQQKYDLLSGTQQQEYSRYQDALAAWQKEADQLWNVYTDTRDTDYTTYRDDIADWKWQEQFDENQRRYNQQWAASHPTITIPTVLSAFKSSAGSTPAVSTTASATGGKDRIKGQTSSTKSQTSSIKNTSLLSALKKRIGK